LGVVVLCVAAVALVLAADPAPVGGGEVRSGSLAFDREVLDLGEARQQAELTATLEVRNTGPRPLERLRALADCGCYEATVAATRLGPGGTTTVTIAFRTLTFTGRFAKHLRIAYDEGGPAESRLRIEIAVVAGVVLKPGRLHLGNVPLGERPQGSVAVVWYEGAGEPFEVQTVRVEGARTEVALAPYEDARDPRWKGTTVTVRFLDPFERGAHAFEATVVTTSATQPEVRLAITAVTMGRLWLPSTRLTLGVVRQGTARTATMPIRRMDPRTEVGRLEPRVRGKRLTAVIEAEAVPEGGPPPGSPPPGWVLAVTVPPDAAAGPIDEVVEILTDVPGEERLEVRVLGHVGALDPAGTDR
jgi:hypothetical protein